MCVYLYIFMYQLFYTGTPTPEKVEVIKNVSMYFDIIQNHNKYENKKLFALI